MFKQKTRIIKKVIINLITFFIAYNNLYSQPVFNNLYILQSPNTCTACLGLYGDYLSKIDRRFEINFVFDEKNDYTEVQLKQIVNNYYFLKRPFHVIQKDSLVRVLLKIAKLKSKNLDKIPLLFYSNENQKYKVIDFVDKIPEKINEINSYYALSINIKTRKLKVDDDIVNSCPNCFFKINNDTLVIGNPFTSKINFLPLNESNNTSKVTSLNLLSNENYLQIFKRFNRNDTSGYTEFRSFPLAPIITIENISINNKNYFTNIYYTVVKDSFSVFPGPIKYGLIKYENEISKLIPIIYKDSLFKQVALYNFIDLKNDTLIFMLLNHEGLPECGNYFLAKFKKYADDSIVFLNYLTDIKYNCVKKNFQPNVIPVFRNEWILLTSNKLLYNVKTKLNFIFDIKDFINFYDKNDNYRIIERQINWIDFVESNDNYKLIFADKKKIFIVYISKLNGKILNGHSYSLTERGTNIIYYKNNYYYLSLNSILTQISFK